MKQKLTIVLVLMIVGAPLMGAMTVSAQYSGDGTDQNPYQISTASEFASIQNTSAHYVLTSDIDLSNTQYTPLNTFEGSLDGDGHTISGITIDQASDEVGGLVNTLDEGGSITDLTISDVDIHASGERTDVGIVAGETRSRPQFDPEMDPKRSSISDVTIRDASITVSGGERLSAGGVVATNNGDITNVDVDVDIINNGDRFSVAGGIVSNNRGDPIDPNMPRGSITDAHYNGSITITNSDFTVAGGLVGRNEGTISDSSVSPQSNTDWTTDSGLVVGDNRGEVTDSYYYGDVPDGMSLIGDNMGDVNGVSTTPVAAIKTQAMMIGSPIVFDASGSELNPVNADDVSYTWESNGETITSDSSTIQVTHRSDGTHTLTLTVTTPDGSDTTSISYQVDDVPLDNFADEFDSESLDNVLISEADEMGGDVTSRVTVESGQDVYSGVLLSETQKSWDVGSQYTVDSSEQIVLVYDEVQQDGNMTPVNASTVEFEAQDSYTITSAVSRTDGSQIQSVEWTDYTDDTTLMDDVSSYTSASVPVDSGDSDSETELTPLGELTDTDKLILLGLGGGIFLVLVSRRMY